MSFIRKCTLFALLTLILINIPVPVLIAQFSPAGGPFTLHWSPDGTMVAGTGSRFLKIWNSVNSEQIVNLENEVAGYTYDIAWSPDSSKIAVTIDSQELRVYAVKGENIIPGQLVYSTIPSANPLSFLRSVDWHPDGQTIVIGGFGEASTLKILSANTGEVIERYSGGDITDLEWRNITNSSELASINEWDPAVIYKVNATASKSQVIGFADKRATAIKWNLLGNKIAIGYEDGAIVIWDYIQKQQTISMQTSAAVRQLAWDSNGVILASADASGTVKLWDALSGQMVKHVDAISIAVAFSPVDEQIAYTAGDGIIEIKNLLPFVMPSAEESGRAKSKQGIRCGFVE